MRLTTSNLALVLALSFVGTSFAQFGSATSAGFEPNDQAVGTATYSGDSGFAHSLSDHEAGFVRSSAVGVSNAGEISYSRSIAQSQGDLATGSNLQVLNGSQGSHFSGGRIVTQGSTQGMQVQGRAYLSPSGVQGGAVLHGRAGVVQGRTFAITAPHRRSSKPRFASPRPFGTR